MAKKFTRAEIRRILGEACTDEIENELVALHLGVVDPLKEDLTAARVQAEKAEDLEKKLNDKSGEDYKTKYETEHAAFENYKKRVDGEKTHAAKEKAVKAYFESKGITGANLDIALMGAHAEIEAVELDGENIKDTKALDTLIGGTFKGLVGVNTTQGAKTPNPISNTGGTALTKAEIYKKDDSGKYVLSTAERQKALIQLSQQKG